MDCVNDRSRLKNDRSRLKIAWKEKDIKYI